MNKNDAVLELFVKAIDKVDLFEMGITLNVKGLVITGKLISKNAYLKGVASTFEGSGEIGDVFSDMFTELADKQKDLNKVESTEDQTNIVYGVHLTDAKIFNGDSVYNVGYWRGQLSSVDGFSFGAMNRQ